MDNILVEFNLINIIFYLFIFYYVCYTSKYNYNIVENSNQSRNKTFICYNTNTFIKLTDQHEFETLTKLKHIPEVIDILGSRTYKRQEYIVMPYLEDWDRLCDIQSCSTETLISLFIKISKGLKKIHDNNVIHCDIKPANILVSDSFDIVFIDFESTGGTSGYIAPEIINDKENEDHYNEKVDIWSLGMTFLNTYINDTTDNELYKLSDLKNNATEGIKFNLDKHINLLIYNTYSESIDNEMADLLIKILQIDPDNRLDLTSIISELERISKLNII